MIGTTYVSPSAWQPIRPTSSSRKSASISSAESSSIAAATRASCRRSADQGTRFGGRACGNTDRNLPKEALMERETHTPEQDVVVAGESQDLFAYVDVTLAAEHPAGYAVEARDGEIGKVDK